MTEFDWQDPDYTAVYAGRLKMLNALRGNPTALIGAKQHYAENPWDFIRDWGTTFDPRKLSEGKLANMPFILWPRQVELVQWMHESWKLKERGIKSAAS